MPDKQFWWTGFAFVRGQNPSLCSFPRKASGPVHCFPKETIRMESINPQINLLHASYNKATDLELPLLPAYERAWLRAIKNGVTPQMVLDVIKHRQERVNAGVRYIESLRIRNLVGDDDAIGNFIEEAYMLAARKRLKVMDPARASVLRATGRSDQPPEKLPQHVSDALVSALQRSVA